MEIWPDTIEITLDGIAQGGEGVGRWNGRVVFAGGGLPGERVVVALSERREAYARGEVTEIVAASPDRVAPRLPGADHMPWQHIAYPAQLRFKRQILVEQLAKIGGFDDVAVAETVAASRPWGYRNAARLHVQRGDIGYYANSSRTIQPIISDPLLLPVLDAALTALRTSGFADADLDEVVLRASETDGYAVASLRGYGDLRSLAQRWMNAAPGLAGVTLPDGELGSTELTEDFAGLTFLMRPEAFFQINLASAQVLLGLARRELAQTPDQRLLDLFCGVGTFALPLARGSAEVVGVEEFAGAVRDAEATAAANGIANTRFAVGPVERVLAEYTDAADAILLDPPRRGCHPRALEAMVRLAPARIVYISCHPGTLARDLKILAASGYQIVQSTPVDLFPQTPHIESITTLMHV